MAIISAASAAYQYNQGSKAAKTQARNITMDNARKSMDTARAQDQHARSGAETLNEASRRAAHDSALFQAVAGEFGGGATSDRGAAVMDVQQGENLASLEANAMTGLSELGFQQVAQTDIANERLAAIARPSALGTALAIGASAAGAYGDYRHRQDMKSYSRTRN